jgi:hypothetical protein
MMGIVTIEIGTEPAIATMDEPTMTIMIAPATGTATDKTGETRPDTTVAAPILGGMAMTRVPTVIATGGMMAVRR